MLQRCVRVAGLTWKPIAPRVLGHQHGRRFVSTEGKKNIVGFTKEELREEFKKLNIEPFRADQSMIYVIELLTFF